MLLLTHHITIRGLPLSAVSPSRCINWEDVCVQQHPCPPVSYATACKPSYLVSPIVPEEQAAKSYQFWRFWRCFCKLKRGYVKRYAVTLSVLGVSRSRLCPGPRPRVHLIRPCRSSDQFIPYFSLHCTSVNMNHTAMSYLALATHIERQWMKY